MAKTAGEAIRNVRVARSTGAKVMVVDGDHPDAPVTASEPDHFRWFAYCEEHRESVGAYSWREAKSQLGTPETWCGGCRAVYEANGGPLSTGSGFSEEERARALEARRVKAEERRVEREREKAARAAARSVDEAWEEFARRVPMLDAIWTEEERAEARKLAEAQLGHVQAVGAARRAAERAEAELYSKVEPKPKRAKELEAVIREAEEAKDREREAAVAVRAERDRLGRRAFLRGAREEGWTVRRNGTGFVLARGDGEPVRIPPDYLPDDEMEVAR